MKRYLLIILAGVISGSLLAQPRLTSNKETHSFGQIEWKKPAVVDYFITNTGNKPLVITNLTASCACTVLDWTKLPIAPGKEGKITVTFDAKALGHFHKSIGIYSNATPHLVYLHFEGEVVSKVTDYSYKMPYAIGNILIDRLELDFPDVHRGENPQLTVNVVNQSGIPYEPVLMHLPPYISVQTTPTVLQKGEKGSIRLTLNTDRLSDLGLTQATVYLSRFAGDKVSEENEIPFSVILLPDFSDMSRIARLNAPRIHVSEQDIDFTNKFGKKHTAKYDVTVTNVGKTPLKINKLQVFSSAVGVDLKTSTIEPGEKTRLRITLNRKEISKRRHLRILMISNDPENPKTVINLRYLSNDAQQK